TLADHESPAAGDVRSERLPDVGKTPICRQSSTRGSGLPVFLELPAPLEAIPRKPFPKPPWSSAGRNIRALAHFLRGVGLCRMSDSDRDRRYESSSERS